MVKCFLQHSRAVELEMQKPSNLLPFLRDNLLQILKIYSCDYHWNLKEYIS